MLNHLFILLSLFPEADWDWYEVSCNPNITWEIIQAYPDWPWDWDGISANPNITLFHIVSAPFQKWDWDGLIANPNVTPNFAIYYLKIRDMDWLSSHPLIDIDWVLDNLTWEWNWELLSANPGIKKKDIKNHLYLPWDWSQVPLNPNIDLKFVKSLPTKDWDYQALARNNSIPWKSLFKFKRIKTKHDTFWKNASYRHDLTTEIIRNNINRPWNIEELIQNGMITWELHQLVPKNYHSLPFSDKINYDIVNAHPEIKWTWFHVAQMSSLTWKQIASDKRLQEWEAISTNHFNRNTTLRKQLIIRKHLQRWAHRWIQRKNIYFMVLNELRLGVEDQLYRKRRPGGIKYLLE